MKQLVSALCALGLLATVCAAAPVVAVDPRLPDYAYVYQWYADGGANNCSASKNLAYVRCVRDPIKK